MKFKLPKTVKRNDVSSVAVLEVGADGTPGAEIASGPMPWSSRGDRPEFDVADGKRVRVSYRDDAGNEVAGVEFTAGAEASPLEEVDAAKYVRTTNAVADTGVPVTNSGD